MKSGIRFQTAFSQVIVLAIAIFRAVASCSELLKVIQPFRFLGSCLDELNELGNAVDCFGMSNVFDLTSVYAGNLLFNAYEHEEILQYVMNPLKVLAYLSSFGSQGHTSVGVVLGHSQIMKSLEGRGDAWRFDT